MREGGTSVDMTGGGDPPRDRPKGDGWLKIENRPVGGNTLGAPRRRRHIDAGRPQMCSSGGGDLGIAANNQNLSGHENLMTRPRGGADRCERPWRCQAAEARRAPSVGLDCRNSWR